MAYRCLGAQGSQDDLWEAISRSDAGGTRSARTHLLATSALHHGLHALVIQAANPWPTLVRCVESGVVAVLNHRIGPDSPLGHFSVLVDVGEDHLLLHDPQRGPDRRIERDGFLTLWLPLAAGSEIAGNVLVAIARAHTATTPCPICQGGWSRSQRCEGCGVEFPLAPAAVLGCARSGCEGRLWQAIFCPYCDRRHTAIDEGNGG